MGINYSYRLYIERDDIPEILKAVADISIPYEKDKLPVKLNSDRLLGSIKFECALKFPLDDELYEYCAFDKPQGAAQRLIESNGYQYGIVGYIYLTITTGNHFAECRFMAATSSMSRLFLTSFSIQSTFQDILNQANGIIGIFDMEKDEDKINPCRTGFATPSVTLNIAQCNDLCCSPAQVSGNRASFPKQLIYPDFYFKLAKVLL